MTVPRTAVRVAASAGAALLTLTVTAAIPAGAEHGGVAAAAAPVDSTGAPGIGDPYFPAHGNGGYDVEHYRVHVTYRTWSGALRGRTTVRALSTQPLTRFNLDLALRVDRVTVDGEVATTRQPDRHELVVTPAHPIPAGSTFTVRVRYHGTPERVVVDGVAPWVSYRSEALAVGQPEIAAWWFPSNDHPRDKATFDVTVRVPRGQQAVSNGVLVSRSRGPRLTSWHWRMADPMATYLAFFAAGRFQLRSGVADGVPYVDAVSERLPPRQQQRALRLLGRTRDVVAWLVDRYGPYPTTATGGVVTSLFTGFALENQSRPTYPYLGADRGATSILVHELAHQWFGDSVAVDRWRDIWLNEGFASFVEWLWAEDRHGIGAAGQLERRYAAYGPGDGFWQLRIADPGPRHLFDAPVYERGAMTLQALRQRIGDADFATLLGTWATDHADGNVRSSQFEALAETVSGQDLTGFFDAWLRTPGRPAATEANGLG